MERSLHVVNGHEHTQIKAIRDLSGAPSVAVLTAESFEQGDLAFDEEILPVLSTRRYVKHTSDAALVADIKATREVIEARLGEGPVSLVVPSAYEHEIRICLGLLHADVPVRVALRLLRDELVENLTEAELADIARYQGEGRLSCHTETEELTGRLQSRFGLASEDNFLLPCTISPEMGLAPRRAEGPFRVGFLGSNRDEKGAGLIPAIVSELAGRLGSERGARRLDVVLQWPDRIRRKPRKIKYPMAVMRAAGLPLPWRKLHIDWYQGGVSSEAFIDMVASMDVLLVPYGPEYTYRGSGMIIDGVLAGVPIVHSRDIGMKRFLAFGNARPGTDPASFADAILAFYRDGEGLEAARAAARQEVLAQLDRTRALLSQMA